MPKQTRSQTLAQLAQEVRACRLCENDLPLGPRPVFQVGRTARVLIAAQAPGTRVHASGRPFTDPSGDRLREWMGIDESTFYDARQVAIIPMGFCYPGRGRSGDNPPRPECAPAWRKPLLAKLPHIRLTLVIGQYAHRWHLPENPNKTLTETVRHWQAFLPAVIPLPHPSPRNNGWLRNNPWFDELVVPEIRQRVADSLTGDR